MNPERECGPDCMAYQDDVPDGTDYKYPDGTSRQWARCMALTNVHKLAKHVVIAANILRVADHRNSQVAPPVPVVQVPR